VISSSSSEEKESIDFSSGRICGSRESLYTQFDICEGVVFLLNRCRVGEDGWDESGSLCAVWRLALDCISPIDIALDDAL